MHLGVTAPPAAGAPLSAQPVRGARLLSAGLQARPSPLTPSPEREMNQNRDEAGVIHEKAKKPQDDGTKPSVMMTPELSLEM
jgi:hypothetical protein